MEMMLLSSFEEWRRHGYECDVLATGDTVGPAAQQIRDSGYGVFHIALRSKWRYLPRLKFVSEFYGLCRSGYDVVHIHPEAGRPVFAILAKLAGVRRVAVTPHGIFSFRGVIHARKFCERHIIRMLGGRFGLISNGVSENEWQRYRIKGVPILNWLNTSHFRPSSEEERAIARQSLGIGLDEFVIVSVGNCRSVKNHNAVLCAIPMLPATIRPLYLHVGREEPDSPERKLAAELKIESEVRFLGSQADALPFLWAADVFVMPSLNEGLSIAAMEAIASGVPVLFSDISGLSEVATGTKWTIFTSTSPESVAEGLAKVAAVEPSERRRRAREDSDLIRERFSVENGVRSIINGLYAEGTLESQTPNREWGRL
jgi:glycosyltransferase involved in cell wall biosynthesis